MSRKEYQNELNNLYIELEKVERMSELEACDFCNADSKQDALEAIQEEIDYWEKQIRDLEDEDCGVDLFSVSLKRCALFV